MEDERPDLSDLARAPSLRRKCLCWRRKSKRSDRPLACPKAWDDDGPVGQQDVSSLPFWPCHLSRDDISTIDRDEDFQTKPCVVSQLDLVGRVMSPGHEELASESKHRQAPSLREQAEGDRSVSKLRATKGTLS